MNTTPNLKQQIGAVLVISLIMLLLLTLIGVTGTQVTSLEEKMAGNMRDRDIAFQAAESTLQFAETSLATSKTFSATGTSTSGTGYYSQTSTIPTSTSVVEDSFWTTNPVATYTASDLANSISNPKYIIQELGTSCAVITSPCPTGNLKNNYRVTVRASGGTANAVVILQSNYQIP